MRQKTALKAGPRPKLEVVLAAASAAALAFALVASSPAAAQCTLAGSPTQFEPNPPGAARPDSLKPFLSIGGFYPFYANGMHLLVTENFGYQVVDISTRANPAALGFEDYRISPSFPGPIPCNGDCHSTMGPMNVSPDGQRAIFGLNALQSSPYQTVVGQMSANGWQYTLAGDMGPGNPGGVLVQNIGATYFAYTFGADGVRVADVTALPGLTPGSLQFRLAGSLPGNASQPILTGAWVTYTDGSNVYLVNVTNPLPASALTAQSFNAASFGRPTDQLAAYTALQDSSDPTAVFILGEFRTGNSHGGWTMIRVKSGAATAVGTVRPLVGETNTYAIGLGADVTGGQFGLMWVRTAAGSYRLYSSPASTFGGTSGFFDTTVPNAGHPTVVAGTNAGEVFAYIPAGSSGWVVPMSCVSQNAPAASSISVSSYGQTLANNATVFLGDQLDITPLVNPSPAQKPLVAFDATDAGYRFDFDFHTGNAIEDAGASAHPRLKNSDANLAFGAGQPLPAAITLVGPCDVVAGGTPNSGAGCWNSVKTNSAQGGPDFTGAEAAGTVKPLVLALEANNQYGSGGASTFTINWKVPAARVASTQVLTGQPLVNGSDGHPTATGFKWYFGDTPSALVLAPGCTGPTCVPTIDTKGTHSYWLTATYATGFSTPDYVASAMGTYTVTDFAPAFSVNSSTTGITALISQNVTVSNTSQRGNGIVGAYLYNLCLIPNGQTTCPAGAYTVLPGMIDPTVITGLPATTAPLQMPSTKGSYLLRIQINYTGGTTYWPDASGTNGFPINVVDIVPSVRVYTNSQDPCPPGPGGSGCNGTYSGYVGDTFTAYSYLGNARDTQPPAGIAWDIPSGSPSSALGQGANFQYTAAGTYTVTLNGYSTPATATVVVTQRSTTPLTVNAQASASFVAPNTNVTFSCNASGGTGNYQSYNWSFSDGGSGAGQSYARTFGSPTVYTATCAVNDGATQAFGSTTVTVSSGSGGSQQIWFKDSCGFGCSDKGFITVGTGTALAAWAYVNGVPDTTTPNLAWSAPGGNPSGGSGRILSYKYDNPGTYTLTLNGYGSPVNATVVVTGAPTGGGCTAFDFDVLHGATSVRTISAPGAGGGGTPFTASVGWNLTFSQTSGATPASWAWDFNDGSTATAQTPQHAFARAGIYTVSLAVPSANGQATCTKSNSITIAGPSGDFTPQYNGDNTAFVPTNVAPNKNVLFTAADAPTAVDTYVWDFGDGSAHQTGRTATHAFSPGNWTVTLTVTSGTASVSTTLALTVADEPKWAVPGMAYVTGANGTLWQSDVTISNPDKTNAANYAVAFLDANKPVDDGAKLSWFPITVPPLGSASSGNVLAEIFGQQIGAYGALMVRGDLGALAPVITARTFNNGDVTKGTFGLSVPPAAVSSGGITAQAAPAASLLIGLRENEKAYTNLGIVNMSNEWPKVQVDFLDGSSGALLLSKTVDMMPYQSFQVSHVLAAAGYANPSNLYSVKISIVPQGPVARPYSVYPFATVIDSGSTDPIVVTPNAAPASSYRIPGIVRLTGAHGEKWRSRVTVTNPSTASRKVSLSFSYVPCRNGTCFSRLTVPLDVKMTPGQTQSWDDLVSVWLQYGAGLTADDATSYQNSYLDVQPATGDTNTDPLVVLGETYNDTPTGHVGLQIPGYVAADGARTVGANKRLVLAGLTSTAAYRTNLALFVASGAAGKKCTVHRYSPAGAKLGEDIDLVVDGTAQIDVASGLGAGLDLSRITVVVDGIEDGTTLAGYATIIDNTSGDSTFVKAQPVP